MSSIDYLDLCRLCLVKESAFVPIFDGEGDGRQIFLKIAACLPVKVTRDDKLPKKICNECVQKIELFYQFCNTTTNAEKQLLEWIGGVDLNDKQTYVSAVINQDQSSNNRLDGNVMQQTNEQHQNNIDMNMMESIGLEMPMMIQQNQTQMTINYTNNTNAQSMQSNTAAQQQNNSKNMDDSDDDHCGGDDDMGQNEELSVKEEIHDSNRTIEPAFVNVSIPCEEAGPSGLQQKSGDIPDGQFLAGQSTDGDPKSGSAPIDNNLSSESSESSENEDEDDEDDDDDDDNDDDNDEEEEEEDDDEEEEDDDEDEDEDDDDDDIEEDDEDDKTEIQLKKKLVTTKKIHTCHICNKNYNKNSGLINHMVSHSDSRPHKCSMCSNTFKTKIGLSRHIEIHEENPTVYFCHFENCDFSARSKSYVKVHYIRKHTNDYKLKCEYCGKLFKIQSDLTTHMKDHDNESCICDICGKTYNNKSSLTYHRYNKHKEIIKNFSCEDCNKRFKTKKNLSNHMELHKTKYICEECGAQLKTKYGLTKHRKIHLEKSHVCPICGVAFSNLSSQKVHLLRHVGERPYVCDICGQNFSQRSPMMSHRKRKHPGDLPPLPPIKITDLLHGVRDKSTNNK